MEYRIVNAETGILFDIQEWDHLPSPGEVWEDEDGKHWAIDRVTGKWLSMVPQAEWEAKNYPPDA